VKNVGLTGCSEIAAITGTAFLALERNNLYGGSPTAPGAFKRIYKSDLAGATDVLDGADNPAGKFY